MRPVRIALTKGRLEKEATRLFDAAGFNTVALREKGRRLILPVEPYEIILAKAADVITYIDHGVCDVGIVGKDTILEYPGSYYEMLDLRMGNCNFALAGPRGFDFYEVGASRTVATKYPHYAAEVFAKKGMDVPVIKIEGSVELAPLLQLADAIVDIVETGKTLQENGLAVLEIFAEVSARVIVNMASFKLRREEIESLIQTLETARGALEKG